MGKASLLSSGVALALNVINCESEEPCRGTDRDDLIRARTASITCSGMATMTP